METYGGVLPYPTEITTPPQRSKKAVYRQHIVSLLASLAAFCSGSVQGWTAAALPYLQNTATPGALTDEEASWVASVVALGAVLGTWPAGWLSDRVGRRTVLLALVVPYMTGWGLLWLAGRNVGILCAARFIFGMALGATAVLNPLYNEEVSEPEVRGALCVYPDLFITFGILWAYVVGAALPSIQVSAVLPVIFVLLFLMAPESPVSLYARGKFEEAEKSLRWLRASSSLHDPAIKAEMAGIQRVLTHPAGSLYKSQMKRPLLIVLGLMVLQQVSGINAVIYYTVDIFREAGSSLSPVTSTIIIGVIQVVATLVAAVLVDRIGRRPLLLVSSGVSGVCLAMLALDGWLNGSLGWLPLTAVTIYIIAFSVGLGPLPWLFMAELAPQGSKGTSSAIVVSVNWALTFVVTKTFESVFTELGAVVTYSSFSLFCIVGTVLVYFYVPETKGKTREELQIEFGL